jgi:hypothetical protein
MARGLGQKLRQAGRETLLIRSGVDFERQDEDFRDRLSGLGKGREGYGQQSQDDKKGRPPVVLSPRIEFSTVKFQPSAHESGQAVGCG